MSTEFRTQPGFEQGEVVGVRFWGGQRGVGAQMAVTEVEFEAFKDCKVFGSDGSQFESAQEFVDSVKFVEWDSAERNNQWAREMENHRFVEVQSQATNFRQRARECARQQMSVV